MTIAEIIGIGGFPANAATHLCTFLISVHPGSSPNGIISVILSYRLPVTESMWAMASVSLEKCLTPPSLSLSTTPFSPTR
jgi:hypothetical protein